MYDFIEIEEIEESEECEDTYDITVEDNHNFFANGILVHNCLGGVYAGDYWENRESGPEAVLEAMRESSRRMQEIFGEDWYGELQWNYVPEQHELNQYVIQVCAEFNIELVSTADAHFPRPELWKYRELYKRFGWKRATENAIPETHKELGYLLYPKNGDQMFKEYYRTSQELGIEYDEQLVIDSIQRTHDIAFSKIEDFEPNQDLKLPSFILDVEEDPDTVLRELSFQVLEEKGLHEKEDYVARLERELKVLSDTKFSKYFIAMNAVSKEAQKFQLTGPGRGSAGGSLIAYLLKFTEVDPLRWNTQFERFMRSDSKDMPDIDYDVEDPMEFKNHLINLWGEHSVVPISTVATLQISSLIKVVSKYYGVDFAEVNNVTTVIDEQAIPRAKEKYGITAGTYKPTFEEYVEFSPALSAFFDKYPEVKEPIEVLLNQPQSIGRHAGGVVISENLNRHMPLISSKGVVQTPWTEGQNVRHLEPMGFIKFDLLGLSTLRMIKSCIVEILKDQGNPEPTFEQVKEFYNENLHIDILDVNDQKVYKNVFQEGNFPSVFQFSKNNAQNFCMAVKPESLIDISIITSIQRPGPLTAKVDENYLKARQDPATVVYRHPKLKEITESTLGFLIFQEQIAEIAHHLGENISLDEANQLRKVLTKKGTGKEDKIKKNLHDKFTTGCINNNLTQEDAQQLWDEMEFFSGYGFNKSHAVAYSLVSYQCAWLFTYYPDEWLLSILAEDEKKRFDNMNIAKQLGYTISPPNINYSQVGWYHKDKVLYQPLSIVKGLGQAAVDEIILNRPFNCIEDILLNKNIRKSKLKSSNLEALTRVGGLDDLIDERFTNRRHFWAVIQSKPRSEKKFMEFLVDPLLSDLPEFTEEEDIENVFALTKNYPLMIVLDDDTLEELEDSGIHPISEYHKGEYHWFVATSLKIKYTEKTKKSYWAASVIDTSFQMQELKIWAVSIDRDVLELNKVYIVKGLEYDEKWGYSTGHKAPFWKNYGKL